MSFRSGAEGARQQTYRQLLLGHVDAAHSQAEQLHYQGSWNNAVKCGDLDLLKQIAYSKGDGAEDFFLNNRDGVGATVLHVCFLLNGPAYFKMIRWLMSKFPKLIMTRYDTGTITSYYHGENVLHIAIVKQNFTLVRDVVYRAPQLLHHRATGAFFSLEYFRDKNGIGCYYGELPLLFAASTAQPAVFRFLAEQPSVDLYAADSQGNTALHLMVMHKLTRMYDYISELWKSMYEENPARRLGRPPLWTVRNVEGLTPLYFAAKLGKRDVFSHILDLTTTELWAFGPVRCVLYPLEELDGIYLDPVASKDQFVRESMLMARVARREATGARVEAGLVDEPVEAVKNVSRSGPVERGSQGAARAAAAESYRHAVMEAQRTQREAYLRLEVEGGHEISAGEGALVDEMGTHIARSSGGGNHAEQGIGDMEREGESDTDSVGSELDDRAPMYRARGGLDMRSALDFIIDSEWLELLRLPRVREVLEQKWQRFASDVFMTRFNWHVAMLSAFVFAIVMQSSLGDVSVGMWMLRDSRRSYCYLAHGGNRAKSCFLVVGSSENVGWMQWAQPLVLLSLLLAAEVFVYVFAWAKFWTEFNEIRRKGLYTYVAMRGAGFIENATAMMFSASMLLLPVLGWVGNYEEASRSDIVRLVHGVWAVMQSVMEQGYDQSQVASYNQTYGFEPVRSFFSIPEVEARDMFPPATGAAIDAYNADENSWLGMYRMLLALGSLGAWGTMIFFLLGFETTGPYIVAIYEMLRKDLSRFSKLMIVLLVGYTQAGFILEGSSKSGGGGIVFLNRIYRSFRAVLQDYYFQDIDAASNVKYYSVIYYVNAFAWALLLVYVVLMSVLLLNTLIASMNDTYSSITSQAETRWRLEQARIIRSLEYELDWEVRKDENHMYWTAINGKACVYMEEPVHAFVKQQQLRDESVGRKLVLLRDKYLNLDQVLARMDEEAMHNKGASEAGTEPGSRRGEFDGDEDGDDGSGSSASYPDSGSEYERERGLGAGYLDSSRDDHVRRSRQSSIDGDGDDEMPEGAYLELERSSRSSSARQVELLPPASLGGFAALERARRAAGKGRNRPNSTSGAAPGSAVTRTPAPAPAVRSQSEPGQMTIGEAAVLRGGPGRTDAAVDSTSRRVKQRQGEHKYEKEKQEDEEEEEGVADEKRKPTRSARRSGKRASTRSDKKSGRSAASPINTPRRSRRLSRARAQYCRKS